MTNSIESLQWRYATKRFDNTKILSKKQIAIFKEAFNLTATSFGLQPIKMVIIQNKELQKQLVPYSMNQQQIADASHVLVICVDNKVTADEVDNYFNLVKKIRNTPDEILNPFKNYLSQAISEKSSQEIFIWAKNQAYLALGNLLTVAAFEKIDSCPMEGFDPKKYDELLQLSKHNISSVLVLPIGYRAKNDFMKDLAKVRKKTNDVVIEIN